MAPVDEDPEPDDADFDDATSMTSAASAGKWLRKAMMQPKCGGSTSKILSVLDSLDNAIATSALQQGNNNNKVPLHYASQFRPELVQEFISRGADVNTATLRGHTPLIFAAGRGHNDVVRSLLQHGANPRIIAVTGDTATATGKTRLDPDVQNLLEEAERASDLPWRDYRSEELAQQAQRDHVKTCPHCRRKAENEKVSAEHARLQKLSSAFAVELGSALLADVSEAPQLLVEKVVPRATRNRDRGIVVPAMRKAIRKLGFHDGVDLCKTLAICRELALKAAFHKQGCFDLRPLRALLAAVLDELEEMKTSWNETIAAAAIVEAADTAVALELLLMKPQHCLVHETDVTIQFCREAFATFGDDFYTHSLFSIPERSLTKKEGGPAVSALQKIFQLISIVGYGSEAWTDLAKDIVIEAMRLGKMNFLLEALQPASEMPGSPSALLTEILAEVDFDYQEIRHKKQPTSTSKLKQQAVNEQNHPDYELKLPYSWVDDELALHNIRKLIEEKIAMLSGNDTVWLAIDTEWGDEERALHGGPSIVQLAVVDRVWVVDTAVLSISLQKFFSWLFSQRCVTFFGFSFGQDMVRLSVLLGEDEKMLNFEVVDVQKLAMAASDKSVTPGLKSLASECLLVNLDKREQCSDWHKRPLTASQLRYAAADAAILLDIAATMQVTS